MYLTLWEEEGYVESETGGVKEAKIKTCWKGYSFDVINKLTNERFLYTSSYKSKLVTLTSKCEELARKLIDKYIKTVI